MAANPRPTIHIQELNFTVISAKYGKGPKTIKNRNLFKEYNVSLLQGKKTILDL